MLTADLLARLQSPAGERALQAAESILQLEPDFLRASQRLERDFPVLLARAAVEQTLLRRRARSKFPASFDLFFTRDGLEQATAEAVALHRARRFEGFPLAFDLGCGIGGDALALARSTRVVAADTDGLRVQILKANASRRTLADRIRVVRADVTRRFIKPPPGTAAFADPSRRLGGRRTRRVETAQPRLTDLMTWLPNLAGLGVKVSPAVDLKEVGRLPCEVEFVSLDGDLKEATLWFGSLRHGTHRATILPEGLTLEAETPPGLGVGPVGRYLIEPDPAVMRAGLVTLLGDKLGARLLSSGIGLLTSDHEVPTPWGRTYRVVRADPFRLRSLQAMLAERGVGRLTIKRRGSPVEPEAIERKLKLRGSGEATILLTRLQGVSSVVLIEALDPERGGPAAGGDDSDEAVL